MLDISHTLPIPGNLKYSMDSSRQYLLNALINPGRLTSARGGGVAEGTSRGRKSDKNIWLQPPASKKRQKYMATATGVENAGNCFLRFIFFILLCAAIKKILDFEAIF